MRHALQSREALMKQGGWRFAITDGIKDLIDFGIIEFKNARDVALAQYKDARVTGIVRSLAEQVKAFGIEGTFKKNRHIASES
jgi:hypothetical protein